MHHVIVKVFAAGLAVLLIVAIFIFAVVVTV